MKLTNRTLAVAAVVALITSVITKLTFFGFPAGIIYLLCCGSLTGRWLFKKENSFFRFMTGFLIFLSTLSLFGAVIYYVYRLSDQVVILILTFFPAFFVAFESRNHSLKETEKTIDQENPLPFLPRWRFHLFTITFLYLVFSILLTLITHPIYDAVRTPWNVIPDTFLVQMFSLVFLFFLMVATAPEEKRKSPTILLMLPACMISFFFLSVPLFAYPMGFGFDPFIHQATEHVIAATGSITPKPLYYLGQYSLVVILSQLLHATTTQIDKILLPFLFSLFLIPAVFYAARKHFSFGFKISFFAAILILASPMGYFIVTTPQGMANLFMILILLNVIPLIGLFNRKQFFIAIFLSCATIALHPIAGIPIFLFVLCVGSLHLRSRAWKIMATGGISLISMGAFPLLFSINGIFSKTTSATPSAIATLPLPTIANKFTIVEDFIYLYSLNISWIMITLGIIGTFFLFKKNKRFLVFPVFFLFFSLSSFLTRFSSFKVISYETVDFPKRILEIGFYFLFPPAIFAIGLFFNKLLKQQIRTKLFFFILFSLVITSSLYLSYPRHDRYITGRSFNLTQNDIGAVHVIQQNAQGKKYIALANQMVSVAALKEFGFVNYYPTRQGELFYYPIPTSSPLYDSYLKMVYDTPSRDNIEQAMELMNVDLAYFVLNDYWWDFKKLVTVASTEADEVVSLNNGKIYIFKYEKK